MGKKAFFKGFFIKNFTFYLTLGMIIYFGNIDITICDEGNKIPKMPMRYDFKETAEYRWLQKPVLDSLLLDDMEKPDNWSHQGLGEMIFTQERFIDGKQSVRLSVPTSKVDNPSGGGSGYIRCRFTSADWRNYNRLSFWIYPTFPGFHSAALIISIDNEGSTGPPDIYGHEKSEYVTLEPDKWNHIVWEIDDIPRDKINSVNFVYLLCGRERESAKTGWLDIDRLELQKVELDNYEGWNIPPGKISFSHSGYQIGLPKSAFASKINAVEFKIINVESGKTVLTKPVQTVKTHLGQFQMMDFSEVGDAGTYCIEAGNTRTRPFKIDKNVWRESIWKTINFFYCERCGTEVPGIHSSCHGDLFSVHGDKSIVIDGGWHDAGDLSQMTVHTSEATYAMFGLAEKVKNNDPILYDRLIEEARWGLDWILKTRFGDGYRTSTRGIGEWTDGIIGTSDDHKYQAENPPFENFITSAAEAAAGRTLKEIDPVFSGICIKAAKEDWEFAVKETKKLDVEISGVGGIASTDLYEIIREKKYLDKAIEFADVIINSQQRIIPDWDIPLTGFFYSDPEKIQILRYNPRSQEHAPIIALAKLCELAPDNPLWIKWYSSVVLYSEYIKNTSKFSEPYGMIPCSIYRIDEKPVPGIYSMQATLSKYDKYEAKLPQYKEQVLNGVKLSKDYYLRIFPVWYSHRGNHGIILAQAKAISVAAHLRSSTELKNISQLQLEWIIGRNPFCQSTMFGEGYDYAPLYTPASGHMVGSLPVGIETRLNNDLPYWPSAINYNYKEVWVHPSSRWLWLLEDFAGLAQVSGQVNPDVDKNVKFQEIKTGQISEAKVDPVSGNFKISLSEGDYTVFGKTVKKEITLISGGVYYVNLRDFLDFRTSQETLSNGKVNIKVVVEGKGKARFTIRTDNLKVDDVNKEVELKEGEKKTIVWSAEMISTNEPWIAVIVPNDNLLERKEIIGFIKK